MRCKSSSIFISFVVITISCNFALADCPSADLSGDCFVDFEDFALMAAQWPTTDFNDLEVIANQWLTTDPCVPDDMAYIPDGEFQMGDHHDGMSNALPIHTVTLDSFYMSKYEITNQQYCDYLNSAILTGGIKVDRGVVYDFNDTNNIVPYCDTSTSYPFSQIDYSGGVFSVRTKDGTTDMSEHPMVTVCWYGAAAYCNWRSQQEGYEQCYDLSTWDCDFSKKGYRLSTEAEWEYAARGGKHSPYYRYPWGDSIDGSKANNEDSGDPFETGDIPWTTPVGYYDGDQVPAGGDMANGYGLYDMSGNVWEWCNDWYNSTYYSTSPYDNPRGSVSGDNRVLRGGSWASFDLFCRVYFRFNFRPIIRTSDFGFRVVLNLEHVPEDPNSLVWVDINDPGVSGHEGFTGYMSKYETTNAQYCQFLNAALASGDITVGTDNIVRGANGSNSGVDFVGEIYFATYAADSDSQITYSGDTFSVRSRDGYNMGNHPVVEVSWYGATAFCNYYGYRLPTEWEWQAVADYEGSYTYGCGTSINQSKANYYDSSHANPLNLSSYPYTSPVDHYSSYGYGMNDMTGNVWEWTSSIHSGSYRVLRGGCWGDYAVHCTVSFRGGHSPYNTDFYRGFRVCR